MEIRARYIVPVEGDVIEYGAIAVAQGCIQAIGEAATKETVPTGKPSSPTGGPAATADDTVIDHGDCVILPGLVNAHTHLELSLLGTDVETGKPLVPTGKPAVLGGSELTDWLLRLVQTLRDHPPTHESVARAVAMGVDQSLASGVTMIGDITRYAAWSRPVLAEKCVRGVSFGEVVSIGNRRHTLQPLLDEAIAHDQESDWLRAGVSPHSPYTVEPDAMRACAQVASRASVPICVHACETADEDAFTRNRTGKLASYLRRLGVWDDAIPANGVGPVELLRDCGLLGARTVLAHANYVSARDITMIAQARAAVAYCPRTHAAFDHHPHRFRDMLDAGINVCIGTDSLASNPSLSVLEELRFLHRLAPDVSADRLIKMATLNGAKALGLDRFAGSLTVGKLADLVVIPLSGDRAGSDRRRDWSSILDADDAPQVVYLGGQRVV